MRTTVCFGAAALLLTAFFAPPSVCGTAPGPEEKPGECSFDLEGLFEGVRIRANLPSERGFDIRKKTLLILYALPNGNTIEWTEGKNLPREKVRHDDLERIPSSTRPGAVERVVPSRPVQADDDWHYDIQHIAAQTRFLRDKLPDRNVVTVYLQTEGRSWPAFISGTPGAGETVTDIVDRLSGMFHRGEVEVVLNGHSGGGRFVLEYIDRVDSIPDRVKRIAFLDSDYAYEDSLHRDKLVRWLRKGDRYLNVTAYEDSTVVFAGKPLVSAHGGTWYRSRLMQRALATAFPFETRSDTAFLVHRALDGRVQFLLKRNPKGEIFHTVLVERNGFIHSILSGTPREGDGYVFWGPRAYGPYIR